jgi:hypothetical protein
VTTRFLGAHKPRPVPDPRNLRLASILRVGVLPPIPSVFNLDQTLPITTVPDYTDGNDTVGDCVIAFRAKWTRRAEDYEQGLIPLISEADILAEYYAETGGPDSGLDLQTSLNCWRNNGWVAGGQHYKIYAYAAVDWHNHVECQQAMMNLRGMQLCLALPESAKWMNGIPWHMENRAPPWYGEGVTLDTTPGSWGYHAVYTGQWQQLTGTSPVTGLGWNEIGPVCLTWGYPQQMTWEFWDQYVCEAWAMVDDRDIWLPNSPVDPVALDTILHDITNAPPKMPRTLSLDVS